MRVTSRILQRFKYAAAVLVAWSFGAGVSVLSMLLTSSPSDAAQLDRSGRPQVGIASYYARKYSGRTMSDGSPMRLYSNNAASLTLPLGSIARVRNLATGLSAVIAIRDRGPYVRGRIVDLSPATARAIGLPLRRGLARVEVDPLAVPMPDGTVRQFSAASRAARRNAVDRG